MDRRFLYGAFALVVLGVSSPDAALARPAPVRVLVAATVSDAAKGTMSPDVWRRLVMDYVNAEGVPFSGGTPTLDDCHTAKAAFMVNATFDTVPRLPGMTQPKDRLTARSRVVATNCITGNVMFDKVIPLQSSPTGVSNEGDLEPNPDIRWDKAIRETLGRNPLVFTRVARIVRVEGPFCFIDFPPGSTVQNGNTFRVFADKDSIKRAPVLLTITDISGKYAQCLFDSVNNAPPAVGDLVEPADQTK